MIGGFPVGGGLHGKRDRRLVVAALRLWGFRGYVVGRSVPGKRRAYDAQADTEPESSCCRWLFNHRRSSESRRTSFPPAHFSH